MNKETLIKRFVRGEYGRNHNAMCHTVKEPHTTTKRLTLHQTDIVTVDGIGSVVLDNGGWYTATTKSYINLALKELGSKWSIVQRAGSWFVINNDGDKMSFDKLYFISSDDELVARPV